MRSRILPLPALAVTAALLLSGCISFDGQTPKIDPDKVATTAEDALEKQVGSRPDIDCGKDQIALEKYKSITCLLTDPSSGLEFDIVITFTEVKGTDYTIDLKVADAPNNPPEPTVDPSAPQVSGDDIAALAVQALTPGLGFPPDVTCPDPTVDIVVGNTAFCSFTDDNGTHKVQVTITSYDPDAGTYEINAKVIDS